MCKDSITVSDLQKASPDKPVVVTRHGKTLGFFVPTLRHRISRRLAKEIQATIEEMSDESLVKAMNYNKFGKTRFVSWNKLKQTLPK